ncbi:MAG TPA: ABC transporter permease [Vicinamibacterales bacterium]
MSAMTTSIGNTAPALTMPLGRVFRAYVTDVKCEALRMLRAPAFAIPFLLLPVPIYLFFGVMLPSGEIAKNPGLGSFLFASWCVFATMGPAMFGAGCTLALDRETGLFRLKRALPAPAGAWLVARTVVAMIFATLAVATLVATALVTGTAHLSAGQLAAVAAVMIPGAIPFCALGLFVGAHVPGSAAPAIINIIFLPMLWLSGLFFPLPDVLERFVVIWPAFHLNQAAVAAAGIDGFRFVPPQLAAAVLIGITVLFGGLAVRRLARRG